MTNLSEIKVMSLANFNNLSSTDDSKLYFVEEDSPDIIEYSSGTSGYIIFPSGMCIQWGRVTSTTAGTMVSVNLSKVYADTNYAVFATLHYSAVSSSSNYESTGYANSTSQIKIGYYTKNSVISWMTIGQLASGQY